MVNKLVSLYFLVLLSCCAHQLNAQNIVRNSGFEENTGCPGATVFLNNTKYWSSVQNHQGTPDLFWKDCVYNGIGKNRIAPNQLPKAGEGFIGLFCAGDDLREFCTTELSEPMKEGEIYSVEFWVRPAAGYGTGINSFSAHFSQEAIEGQGNLRALRLEPHITNPEDRMLNDTSKWVSISGEYTAKGGEKYITLGNFRNDGSTKKEIFNNACIRPDRSYMLLDEVSVLKTSEPQKVDPVDSLVIVPKTELNVKIRDVFYARSNQLTIEVWDNNVEDGDSVRILINGNVLTEGIGIKKTVQTLNFGLSGNDNLLVVHALNIGSRPPNTLALKITDGKSSKRIIFTTDLKNAQAIKVILKN
jgi:hypothetical protein